MDLVEFVRARLDEDEALANAACRGASGHWQRGQYGAAVEYGEADEDWPDDDPGAGIVVYDEGAPTEAQCKHIACHDPARVLREVEAKRRILALHGPYRVFENDPHATCDVCSSICGAEYCGGTEEDWPCETIRLLALPYSDHTDYRQDWKPY